MDTESPITLRQAIAVDSGLRYIVEHAEMLSPPGRECLLSSQWKTSATELEREYDDTEELLRLIQFHKKDSDELCLLLMNLRDISSTLSALVSGQCMGDIELFELKSLALTITQAKDICSRLNLVAIQLPNVEAVVDTLDPEGTRVGSFYIYDSYSQRLKELRTELKEARKDDNDSVAELYSACSDEELRIRTALSKTLREYGSLLSQGLGQLGRLDMLIARARLVGKFNLTRPLTVGNKISYEGLWNPLVSEALEKRGRKFQPVDIEMNHGVTVITGANMSGKSVVLKSVGLSQSMAQFGFHVPAQKATIVMVDEVMTSIGDSQNVLEGLSSYAAELLCIDKIIRKNRDGKRILALIDEPARTTNPDEGKALVNAIIELMGVGDSFALLTTHYSGLTAYCHRLRVHGFREEKASGHELTATTVNDYIDYSLEQCDEAEAPHEALRIARLIGVDAVVTETAARFLDQ